MRPAIGPGAALAAWTSVLVALNATADPLACAAAFGALALLAVRTGHRRLALVALAVGAGLLLVVPGLAVADGSFRVTFLRAGAPTDGAAWLASAAVALRVPAQVLAVVFVLLVPARLLLDGAARVSPRTALLGALTARLQPLLGRDVRLVRDELASRGLRIGRGAPIAERALALRQLWEGAIAGVLDRAFVSAAALDARGWGSGRPTSEELTHPVLRDSAVRDARVDRAVLAVAVAVAAGAVALRERGLVEPPGAGLVVATAPAIGAGAAMLAVLLAALALLPLLARERRGGPAAAADAPATPPQRTGQRLELQEVSMRHPGAERDSLLDASLVVEPGELVVLAGPSGGGKSTLLDVVSGVAPRTTGGTRSGTIRLGEHVLGSSRPTGAAGRVAAVFQHPESQVLVGRVSEEVAFGPRHAGLPAQVVEQRVLDALDQLAVRHLAARDCGTLSGGELQRVLLAAAIALDPAVLVLDEPTSQVDVATERRFWDVVDRVRRERGIAVLVAEHRLDALLLRADAIVHVSDGRVSARMSGAHAAAHLPQLAANPYDGLVPAPVRSGLPPRLAVRIARLEAGSRTLLRNLAVGLPPGAIVTLEGPNGTGKSTLLRAIRGLHPGAQVLVDGVASRDVGSSARWIAWQSQGVGAMLPGRSVREAATETGIRLGIGDEAGLAALAAAGLADRPDAHPAELSVGERQRLALVAATSHRPPVWLLDEPTRGMDASARRWVACHALAHAAAGGVVVLATHDAQLAAAVATHRLRLDLRTGPSLLPVARRADGAPTDAAPAPVVDDLRSRGEVRP